MTQQPSPRRRYMISAAAITAALGCGTWPLLSQARALAPADYTQANLLCLASQSPAAQVGAAVLPQLAYPSQQALVQALASRLSGFLGSSLQQPCDTGQLHLAFQEAIKDDFAQGRCVSVSGWVLARSEVELCALAALSTHNA